MKAAGWDDGDSENLSRFLGSETGRKLGFMMRDLICRGAIAAMDTRGGELPWQAGRVAGMRDLASFVDSLQASPRPAVNAKEDTRPSDDLDWLHGNQDDTSRTG